MANEQKQVWKADQVIHRVYGVDLHGIDISFTTENRSIYLDGNTKRPVGIVQYLTPTVMAVEFFDPVFCGYVENSKITAVISKKKTLLYFNASIVARTYYAGKETDNA